MSYLIDGEIIGHRGVIPVVRDSDIKRVKSKKKGNVLYKKIHVNTKKLEKAKNLTTYQIFNLMIKERKLKEKDFSSSMEDRKEKWNEIKTRIENGKMKPTKKDIRNIIYSW